MRSLKASRPDQPRRDPAPSRWGYRYQRLMLTPGFRKLVKVGLPALVVCGLVAGWGAREANRQMVADAYNDMKTQIQQRDEFMVKVMAVDGADETLSADVRTVLPVEFPVSSFDLDLEEMRQTVAALPAVADATLRVRPGGILQVGVTQRQPVAVFRGPDGLKLIDVEGVLIQAIVARADRSDLPLITGDGARDFLSEGLEIYRVAGPLLPRMRGVVRMGERRWDVILESGQRILLPNADPVIAFERVVALNQAQDLLERDVAVVDMRNPTRPTIRMNEQAVTNLRQTSAPQE
ncbi:cell division protein FtsQ/DivIB [Octadecabacter sp. 1_MG-2023]|uniref:cell division protein FtsQ/DivIB n=1 Tax=unclassified Octadecabacter TaxID=196158 RepID=UPI001C094038|nr:MULTISPECIES: cell division protein FtsQ/DivIB [unclassified Octadecabacter]MBU2992938.1 cell division protein FtsQ/DivIB [Octadecabacter sp. B2R22]MDO6733611.1 cell division protein FtsQ/DivIB [Octadecabacter sp. 1_MG-2023]